MLIKYSFNQYIYFFYLQHHQRLSELKSALVNYAEGQLKVAKENQSLISENIKKLREFPLPHVNASSLNRPE